MTSMPIYISDMLPLPVSPREEARRIVRHGYAEAGILAWLGEGPGPRPDEQTHIIWAMDIGIEGGNPVVWVSREMRDTLLREGRLEDRRLLL